MRVIHVTPYYPPHLGGVERVAQALAEGLSDHASVEVWTSTPRLARQPTTSPEPNCSDPAVRVRRYPARTVAHTPISPGLFADLLRLPSDSVVHLHVAQALWPEMVATAAKVRRFRWVAHFHLDVDPSGRAGFLLPAYKGLILGRSLRGADRVLALTQNQADFLVESYCLDPSRVLVVPNGAAPEYGLVVRAPRPGPAPLRVLSLGRLDKQKNIARLLNGLALLGDEVETVIVGDGEQAADLHDLHLRLGLASVTFAGPEYGQQLLDRMAWADAFVMSSDREGMPLALLEAMSAGLAPVVTDVSDLREFVGGAGIVTPVSSEGLADGLAALARDRSLLARCQQASRQRAGAHSWDATVHRLLAVYREVAA
jgi:glycosyltransferase involved in cell wall biosynthesis